MKTSQLYKRLGAFHGQIQETLENEVSAVLCLQQNDIYSMLFVLRETYGFWKVDRTHHGEVRTRYND